MLRRILTYNESFISHNIPQTKRNNFSPQRLAHIAKQINTMKKPIISMHQHPDGDAWGSAIAVSGYLKTLAVNRYSYW
jgi:proteasome lid subunit RPN8/RPN11